jgi:hypothetical protein
LIYDSFRNHIVILRATPLPQTKELQSSEQFDVHIGTNNTQVPACDAPTKQVQDPALMLQLPELLESKG